MIDFSSFDDDYTVEEYISELASGRHLGNVTCELLCLIERGFRNDKGVHIKNDGSKEFRSFFEKVAKGVEDEIKDRAHEHFLEVEEARNKLT